MRGGGAAAAPDDRDPIALDELAQDIRQRLWLLGEDRLAVGPLQRQAGVGDAVHGDAGVLAEEADRVSHVLGTGGAVEPDRVDVERLERRQHGADVGAQQHLAALWKQRHAALDRDLAARLLECLARSEHRRLDLEDVLRGLDDDQVDAAGEQADGLFAEHLGQLGELDLSERGVIAGGQEAGRADRAGDEAIVPGCAAGDLGGLEVDLVGVGLEAPLRELQARRLERVGLEHVRAGLEHRLMHAFDHVGPVEHERFVAAPGELVVALEAQVELLERGAHAAVVDEHTVARGREEVAHRPHANRISANLDTVVARFALDGRPPGARIRGGRRCREVKKRPTGFAASRSGPNWALTTQKAPRRPSERPEWAVFAGSSRPIPPGRLLVTEGGCERSGPGR